jgi:predicted GNAT family acetyltransferase
VLPSDRFRRVIVSHSGFRRHRYFLWEQEAAIKSVVYAGPGGLYFPIDVDRANTQTLPGINGWSPLHSIMGRPEDVAKLEQFSEATPKHRMHYLTMTLAPAQYPEVPPPPIHGLKLARPGTGDWRRLLPLQIAYEKEEVLLPGRTINVSSSRSTLLESLETQLVFTAQYHQRPIARVATNARGLSCDQIGGVYTLPEYRRSGISRWLMAALLQQIGKQNRTASLFVKPFNEAALALYRSLGFRVEGEFIIHYYQSW